MPRTIDVRRPSAVRASLVGFLVVGLVGWVGCSRVGTGPPSSPEAPSALEGPSIAAGPAADAANEAAARLITDARAALDAGEAERALELADEVVARYPEASGSARALLVAATARRDLASWAEGLEAAQRYLELVEGSPQASPGEARVLVSELRLGGGLDGGIESLFDIPAGPGLADDLRERALEQARTTAGAMDEPLLRQLLEEAPEHPWILPVFQVELAERRALVGDRVGSEDLLARARSLEPAELERERLRRIEAGEIEARGEVVGTLGVILSLDGSPTLSSLSEQIREGIEVALLADAVRGGVQLEAVEDQGVATASARALAELVETRPLGVVGPVSPMGFREAVSAASGRVPLIAPTTPVPDGAPDGVYSLTGPDPQAARALAELAISQGYLDVAVFHPDSPEGRTEFAWFRDRFQEGGGRVAVLLDYPAGTNDFRPYFGRVAQGPPQAVVVLAAPQELPILAAQLPFMGLDPEDEDSEALDLPILGNSTWASDQVLSEVPRSRTDGVLSVAPHTGEGYGPLWTEFVATYEQHFQRTLRDPVPALGYDAARLLIEAARLSGGSSPEQVREGLRQIRDLPGATGTLSVIDGRIVRAHMPVRLEGGARIPLTDSPGARPNP